ncbi:DUF3179 domain-containing protein [Lutibacter sp.]|uniref:DUF3179 domain-containing protein n=1 Tax=Lutibacter sp. TaxID=1925666 RepID=UPI0025B8E773|nr:DUF3179 domain-containing protein [Lutibacter sp.]MCF6181668.1 DUF3179 domain-containing protein [Lutibacter sp.]
MKTKNFYVIIMVLLLVSCGGSTNDINNTASTGSGNNTGNNNGGSSGNNGNNQGGGTNSQDWLIPISEVKDGGPGKDGIPSIDNPKFLDVDDPNTNFLTDEDLVIGIVVGDEVRAYPHLILDWHEIVNDEFESDAITISYCPLTGTAFGWESLTNRTKSEFGVSGLLYNANLILYDRNTDSNWSQLKLLCVNGTLIGHKPELQQVIETNWGTWKKLYPTSKVLSLDTGFSRNYDLYPYGDYKTNNDFFLFTASPTNDALPNKERVFALINDEKSKVYQFSKFIGGKAIKQTFNGIDYLVVGNDKLITAFELDSANSNLNFNYAFNDLEVFITDDEGNSWSVFGKALSGPRAGEQLKMAKSVVSYWFAIAAFYPNPIIYS